MPELPDIELYRLRLEERIVGSVLDSLQIFNPFVLRSFTPSPKELVGGVVTGVERLGKRTVIVFRTSAGEEAFIVVHLMIAGRFQWQSPAPEAKKAMGKVQLAALRFTDSARIVTQLLLVEMSTKKRAGIYLVANREGLKEHDRGGLDLLSSTQEAFRERLLASNRTLKRALTDPRSFNGIGNAYSDEILFAARLSPVRTTHHLKDEEIERLHRATVDTMTFWIARLKATIPGFPKPSEITAFRPDFATHGRFGKPCPVCGKPIQHIVYAENETNYCAVCQNEGRLLADRSLSRLLKGDWPKTLEEMGGD